MTEAINIKPRKEWRRLVKKLRRKRIRQNLAEARKEEERKKENSPTYLEQLAKEKLLEEYELEEYERERKERHEKWLKTEEEDQRLWRERERLKNLAKEEKLKELEKIRAEWEAEQQKIKQKKEELERLRLEEENRKQEMLERINDFIINGGEVPPELKTVKETHPGKELCLFFSKVGACRFGLQCSRNHQYPGISKVLLFLNFYSHFTLNQSNFSEYDTDIGLEFEDSDMYLHFKDFYNDVAPEVKKFGNVKMIKVCCNTESHLRGNVYVEYESMRNALVAYQKFHGRWYGSKQLNVEFVNVPDWGRAVCGDFARKRCPKGKSCNFLHVFKNPKNEFPIEWSRQKNVSNSLSESFCDSESPHRSRSFRWSESPVRKIPDDSEKKNLSGKKQESDFKSNNKRKRKSRSRSRSRSRSKGKSKNSSSRRSRSKNKSKSRSRSRSKSKSKSKSRNRSRSQNREKQKGNDFNQIKREGKIRKI